MVAATQQQPASSCVDSGRIVLIGAPARLGGLLRLRNPGAGKLKIKTAALTLKGRGDAVVPLLSIGARLGAGEVANVRVSLALDPCTPPGELHGEALIGDERREVVLKVLEHREAVVTPSRFALHGTPGQTLQVPVVISNVGNVGVDVPRAALIAVAQARAFQQLFHVAMARKGNEGHQAALDAFAKLLHDGEVVAPRVRVGKGGGASLAPGASVETELAFELPADLARHGHYRGTFVLAGAECAIDIVVDTPSGNERPPSTPPAVDKGAPR